MSRSDRSLLRRGLRHPDVLVASAKHHVRRVVTRPIRTVIRIAFTYVFVVGLIAFTSDIEATGTAIDTGLSVATVVPLLPPTYVLVIVAGVAVVSVPISMVTWGVRRDLRSNRSRRRRLEE